MKKIVALVLIIALVSTVAATCFAGCSSHSWKVTGYSYSCPTRRSPGSSVPTSRCTRSSPIPTS